MAGLVATAPMSAVMVAVQRPGRRMPPKAIVDQAVDLADVDVPRSTRRGTAVVAHLGFGAAVGSLFGVLTANPSVRRHPIASGTSYAMAVWAASYLGWVPAIGALPIAAKDDSSRRRANVISHVVFGATLGRLMVRHQGSGAVSSVQGRAWLRHLQSWRR
jgi:hypothetical protein